MEQPLKHRIDPEKFLTRRSRLRRTPRQGGACRLETLWINTGSLCNLTCGNCFMESSPKNDRLVYISHEELTPIWRR